MRPSRTLRCVTQPNDPRYQPLWWEQDDASQARRGPGPTGQHGAPEPVLPTGAAPEEATSGRLHGLVRGRAFTVGLVALMVVFVLFMLFYGFMS